MELFNPHTSEVPSINEYLLSIFDELKKPLMIISPNNELLGLNRAFCDFLGVSPESIKKIDSIWPNISSIDWSDSHMVAQLQGKDELITARLSVMPLDSNVKLVRVVGRVSSGEILSSLHDQRISTLGRLAGGVAHDFNNILTGILGHVSFLKASAGHEGVQLESLTAIEDGARRASLITQQILNFSRADHQQKPERIDICTCISRTFLLLRGAISPRYELTCSVPDKPLFVLADEGKLAQILINLVMNAKDAISVDGSIRVSLEELKDTEKLFGESPVHSYVCLKVVDDGCGMSEEVLKRAFEPYYSTKKDKGTGLGLATVETIVNLYGGILGIDSKVGVGTTVSIYLPLVESESSSESEAPRRIPRGNERILIIDDEAPVRSVLAISLEHLGYSVYSAASGDEGIKAYQENPFDLVLLDMIMPHKTGPETFVELQTIDPQVSVLIISGYAAPEAIDFILKKGGKGFIPKPFTIQELAHKVRETLDEDL
jgi:two-component system cell cycle sensor histidine kinase/response regulator CckA